MKIAVRLTLSLLLCSFVSFAQVETVFLGSPVVKVSEGGIERTPETVSSKDAANLRCVISKIGNKYYWSSRENKELIRFEAGAYTTFVSPEGVGYIRIINPDSKGLASLTSPTEERFDYVEHLLIGLRSVTYYGVMSQ
jgi:hypothetical protein